MKDLAQQLEQEVQQHLDHMLQMYSQVNEALNQMMQEPTEVTEFESRANQVRGKMDSIAAVEQQSRQIIERYRSSQASSSSLVQQKTEQLGGIMQAVLMKIGCLEKVAEESRKTLFPKLQSEVKVVQMKSAYHQYQ